MSRRDKVTESIRKEVSLILHDKFKDPRMGFVTITRVELTADLRNAKIFFSVLGNDENYKKTQEALDSGAGFIRKMLAETINLRYAPEIIFREDRSSEYSVRIQEILNEVKELEKKEEEKIEPKKVRRVPKKK